MFKLVSTLLVGFLGAGATVAWLILMVTVAPWCLIWSINTLVAAGSGTTFSIPFTLWTWLAGIIIVMLCSKSTTQ